MRSLHLACLPYPSPQGTQGLLHAMLSALGEAGHDTHLLCYPEAGTLRSGPYRVHRAGSLRAAGSLRSGPSLRKLGLDLRFGQQLRALATQLQPELYVAHHVEAAALALLARLSPLLFVAHTDLGEELPSYFSRAWGPLMRRLGSRCDRELTRRAARTVAVSPLLAARLAAQSGRCVFPLPLPWSTPPAAAQTHEERLGARARLGLSASHEVALYAGNLDAYQGLFELLPELGQLAQERPRWRLLVATESAPGELARAAQAHGLGARLAFAPLASERDRHDAHAAADVALVPRRCAGGLPIKLLDALARGVPTVAAERAAAGLPVASYCELVAGGALRGFSRALVRSLDAPEQARHKASAGRAYVEREHAPAHFVAALRGHAAATRLAQAGRGSVSG